MSMKQFLSGARLIGVFGQREMELAAIEIIDKDWVYRPFLPDDFKSGTYQAEGLKALMAAGYVIRLSTGELACTAEFRRKVKIPSTRDVRTLPRHVSQCDLQLGDIVDLEFVRPMRWSLAKVIRIDDTLVELFRPHMNANDEYPYIGVEIFSITRDSDTKILLVSRRGE